MAALPMSEIVGTWIAAALTLCIFSFLYKDNYFYKFAEFLFVGSSAGYVFATNWQNNFVPYVFTPVGEGIALLGKAPLAEVAAKFVVIIPACIGLLMVSMLSRNYAYLSRYPICFLIGYGSGFGIVASIKTDILPQIYGTLLPLAGVGFLTALQHLIVILCVVTGVLYFFFSMEHRGPILGAGSRIGILVLMVTFGAQFGTTIMGRIQLLIGRMDFLIYQWWPLVKRMVVGAA